MKKLFATLCALCVLAGSLPAQTGTGGAGLLNLNEYSKLFFNAGGVLNPKYARPASSENRAMLRELSGDLEAIDTPLEIALLSTCAGAIDVRPQLASEMLGNPKQADLKLGAAVFQEMQIVRFMGNTAALGRHEGVLKFITDRGNASRAEIEAFYRQNIGAYIAAIVDEGFNKMNYSFGDDAQQRTNTITAINLIVKKSIADFYLSPNRTVIDTLKTIYNNFRVLDREKNNEANAVAFESSGYRDVARDFRESARAYQQTVSRYCTALNINQSEINFNKINWRVIGELIYMTFSELNSNLLIDR